jgi:hypothetical protein
MMAITREGDLCHEPQASGVIHPIFANRIFLSFSIRKTETFETDVLIIIFIVKNAKKLNMYTSILLNKYS